jgi:Cu-Zn family superoxide dismutase
MRTFIFVATAALGLGGLALAQKPGKAQAMLKDQKGQAVGQVTLTDLANGVLIEGELRRLPAGERAIHVHETGQCTGDFTSAGEHFNPTKATHGFDDPKGPHAGDLPNVHIAREGTTRVEKFAAGLTVAELVAGDGTALVVHANPDDYKTDPSGAAGDRIACGVIQRR